MIAIHLGQGIARTPQLLLAIIALILATFIQAPSLEAESVTDVTITVDCDGVPHVRIEMTVDTGLVKIDAPVEVYPGTLEAIIDGVTVPAVYDNGIIYVAVDKPGHLVITYAGVTELSPEGELYFKLNTAGAQIVMSNCTILTNVPQNLADALSDEDGTLLLKLSGPDEVHYIPVSLATPLQTPSTTQQTATSTESTTASYTLTQTEEKPQETSETTTTREDATSIETDATQPNVTMEAQSTSTQQEPPKSEPPGGMPVTTIALLIGVISLIGAVLAFMRKR